MLELLELLKSHAGAAIGGVLFLVASGMSLLLRNRTGGAVWALVAPIAVLGIVGDVFSPASAWGWVLVGLPVGLLFHHAVYLALVKPRFIGDEPESRDEEKHVGEKTVLDKAAQPGSDTKPGGKTGKVKEQFRVEYERALRSSRGYFNVRNIAFRYGMPAVVLAIVGLAVFYGLAPQYGIVSDVTGRYQILVPPNLEAAAFGAAGAYVYTLFLLGRRGFQHDISTGAALWCAVTLIAGPVLAVVVRTVFTPEALAAAEGKLPTPGAVQAIFFLSGFAPRSVANAIERLARRALSNDPTAGGRPGRPLTLLEGVTPEIADRLSEDGIYDVANMAMADPIRLQRFTAFDPRQILDWIDQALLIRYFGEGAQKLNLAGITGAVDFAWYGDAWEGRRDASGAVPVTWDGGRWHGEPTSARAPQSMQALADAVGIKVELLADTATRMSEDGQVRLVWMLYQLDTPEMQEAAAPASRAGPAEPPPGTAAPAAPSMPPGVPPSAPVPGAPVTGEGPAMPSL